MPNVSHDKQAPELDSYRQFVESVAAKADGTAILNRHADHAAIIMAQLLKSSNDEVDFLTGGLDPSVYAGSDVVSAAKAFLEKSDRSRIRIVYEKDIPADHPFVVALRPYIDAGRVSMKRLVAQQGASPPGFHFAVGDGQHVRFEQDKTKFEAVVMFGSKENGRALLSVFNTIEAKAV